MPSEQRCGDHYARRWRVGQLARPLRPTVRSAGQLDPAFVGRVFDDRFLADLPPGVDPFGERGEFHTCVTAGPMFAAPIPVVPGQVVERDGFAFADLRLG